MTRYPYIKNALSNAKEDIEENLEELIGDIGLQRQETRESNQTYHRNRKYLRHLNNKKRRLLRQLAKIDELEGSLKPKIKKPEKDEE